MLYDNMCFVSDDTCLVLETEILKKFTIRWSISSSWIANSVMGPLHVHLVLAASRSQSNHDQFCVCETFIADTVRLKSVKFFSETRTLLQWFNM